jgi:predicted nucleic acid-binding protein
MKVFIDTNILIDFLGDRKPYSKFAIEIFKAAEQKTITLYATTHSLATTHYLLKKYIDEKKLRQILEGLLEYLNIVPIDEHIFRQGLKSRHKDFEDALQMIAASGIPGITCIVTRNLKDFKHSEVEVVSPDELLKKLK